MQSSRAGLRLWGQLLAAAVGNSAPVKKTMKRLHEEILTTNKEKQEQKQERAQKSRRESKRESTKEPEQEQEQEPEPEPEPVLNH